MEQSASKVVIIWIRGAKAFPPATNFNVMRQRRLTRQSALDRFPAYSAQADQAKTLYLEWI